MVSYFYSGQEVTGHAILATLMRLGQKGCITVKEIETTTKSFFRTKKKKNIQILSSPKLIGQAKIVGSVLSSIDCSKGSNTIVVLGEESIITPVLNYIPKNLRNINVTIKPSKELWEIKNIILQIFEIHSI